MQHFQVFYAGECHCILYWFRLNWSEVCRHVSRMPWQKHPRPGGDMTGMKAGEVTLFVKGAEAWSTNNSSGCKPIISSRNAYRYAALSRHPGPFHTLESGSKSLHWNPVLYLQNSRQHSFWASLLASYSPGFNQSAKPSTGIIHSTQRNMHKYRKVP